jgi:ADP-ribose pyrophosphatase YjhB (NUDIX family)
MTTVLSNAITTLESVIGDAHHGLPEEIFLFVSRIAPLVNVDLLIQDEARHTLLTWRDDEFFGAGWHVPGSIIRYKETAADRVQACARKELGAKVSFESIPLLVSEHISDKNSRGHAISLLYRCMLVTPPDEKRRAHSNSPSPGEWRWHESCPQNLLSAQVPYRRFF